MKPKHIYLLALIISQIIILSTTSTAKDFNLQEFKEKLPKQLGSNNIGNDFWLIFNPNIEQSGNTYLKIYVSSFSETNITIEIKSINYKYQFKTTPYKVEEVNLSTTIGQCYSLQNNQAPLKDSVFIGHGIHIVSDEPIICYAIVRNYQNGGGFNVLPLHALGKDYIISSWITSNYYYPFYTSIIAPYDSTKVNFTVGGNSNSSTSGGLTIGQSKEWNLNEGDVLLISSSSNNGIDLSGSKINSNKPVAVITSSSYSKINGNNNDLSCEMHLPCNLWGNDYIYSPIYNRKSNSYLKIFAKDSNSIIFRNGLQIAKLDSNNGVKNTSWIELIASDSAIEPYVFYCSKPINVSQFNSGPNETGISNEPFMLGLNSLQQFNNDIIFQIPGIKNDITFDSNIVNIIYQTSKYDSIPDDLEFSKIDSSELKWIKVKDYDTIKPLRLYAPIEGKYYFSKVLIIKEEGIYRLRASNPLTAYCYGYYENESYGLPASISTFDFLKGDDKPPNPIINDSCFKIINSFVEDIPRNQLIRSNLAMIIFHKDVSYNYNFIYDKFTPREDSIVNWSASVTNLSDSAKAVITFADCNGNDTTIVIEYKPKILKISSDSVFFGNRNILSDTTIGMFVYNSSIADVNIDSIYLKYNNKGFELSNLNFPYVLMSGDSLWFNVKFSAQNEGMYFDSIGIDYLCRDSNPFLTLIQGFSGDARIDASNYDFGKVKLNNISYGEVEIRNTGTIDLVINEVRGPNEPDVFISGIGDISVSNPLIINPKEYHIFEISFLPKQSKIYNDSIIFKSTAVKELSPDSIAVLSGIGYTDQGPIISVSDADFGYVERYTTTIKNIEVKNIGDQYLTITDYQKPKYYLYNALINPDINSGNPKTLTPNQSWNFDVEFNAEAETQISFNDMIVFNSNAVSGDSIAVLKVDSVVITGIDDYSNNDLIRIIPNPFSFNITIDIIGNNKLETIIICDLFGREVLTRNVEFLESGKTQHITLNTENLPQGVYYVRVQGIGGAKVVVKINN